MFGKRGVSLDESFWVPKGIEMPRAATVKEESTEREGLRPLHARVPTERYNRLVQYCNGRGRTINSVMNNLIVNLLINEDV